MPDPTQETVPTATLLGHAADGDSRARDALCERYRRPLLDLARGRLPAAARGVLDSEDVVQEVLARSIDKVHKLQDIKPGGFLFYLRRGVLNALADEYRKHHARPKQTELDTQHPDDSPSPLQQYVQKEDLERYEQSLNALDPTDQDLIVARIELRQGYQQIAIELGRPSEDAARMAVKRAIARLAEEMRQRRGGTTD